MGKGGTSRKNWNWDIGSKSFFLLFLFFAELVLVTLTLSLCQISNAETHLKDPKRAVERQATFYSLSFSKYNKQGMGGVSNKQVKKTA